jgi:hypothetical protein
MPIPSMPGPAPPCPCEPDLAPPGLTPTRRTVPSLAKGNPIRPRHFGVTPRRPRLGERYLAITRPAVPQQTVPLHRAARGRDQPWGTKPSPIKPDRNVPDHGEPTLPNRIPPSLAKTHPACLARQIGEPRLAMSRLAIPQRAQNQPWGTTPDHATPDNAAPQPWGAMPKRSRTRLCIPDQAFGSHAHTSPDRAFPCHNQREPRQARLTMTHLTMPCRARESQTLPDRATCTLTRHA